MHIRYVWCLMMFDGDLKYQQSRGPQWCSDSGGNKFHLSLGSEDTTKHALEKPFFLRRLDLGVTSILREFFWCFPTDSTLEKFLPTIPSPRARRSASRKWLNPKAMPNITAWQPQLDCKMKKNAGKLVEKMRPSMPSHFFCCFSNVVLISIDFRISC